MKFLKTFTFIFLVLSVQNLFATVKIKPISNDFPKVKDGRKHVELISGWEVYNPFLPGNKITIDLPAIFFDADELVFEKKLNLSQSELDNFKVFLHVDGVNYSSEFFINDQSFFKYPNGAVPVDIPLPKDLMNENIENVLKIKVSSLLDPQNTIPTLQRFLFPENFAGIFGNIYLTFQPRNGINSIDFSRKIDFKKKNISAKLDFKINLSPVLERKNKTLTFTLLGDSSTVIYSKTEKISESSINFSVKLKNPKLYSVDTPNEYSVKAVLRSGNAVVDLYTKKIILYDLEKKEGKYFLNGKRFRFNGVEYTPFSVASNGSFSYQKVSADLDLAKALGFNTIRFLHQLPNEAILSLIKEKGLFAFVEIPDNFIPGSLFSDNTFNRRINGFAGKLINYYSKFPQVIAIGAGSSFLPDSKSTGKFLTDFAEKVKLGGKLSYGTFLALPSKDFNLDLVGLELFSHLPTNENFSSLKSHFRNKVFLSGTYPVFEGNSEGYLHENSFDAQGKYFRDLLKFRDKLKINGLFINTLIDYSGDYSSLYASYDKNKIYKIGIFGVDRKVTRIGYKVISDKLNKGKNVSLPIGTAVNKVPIFFIVVPLFLAVLVGIVLNSRRRFREDAKRALFRSYNFFADIRDQRLLSGFHSYFMMIISSGTISLLAVNILYFLRGNMAFEKILLSFGNFPLVSRFSYLAWHPVNAFLILWLTVIVLALTLSFLVKFFAIFNKTKVLYENIFYSISWAIMPVTLLLVVELLYLKILYMNQINSLVYIFTGVFMLWLLLRLLKGFYVIFDVRPSTVYVFAFGVILFFVGGFFLYYQLNADVFAYLKDALVEIKYF